MQASASETACSSPLCDTLVCIQKTTPHEVRSAVEAFTNCRSKKKFVKTTQPTACMDPFVTFSSSVVQTSNQKKLTFTHSVSCGFAGYKEVFVKEMCYRFKHFLEDGTLHKVIPDNYIHTFIVRNPLRTMPSLFRELEGEDRILCH